MIIKKLLYILPLVYIFTMTGCGDKTQDENQNNKIAATTTAPKIEIVQNENAKAIKVEEKKKTKLHTKDGKAYYYDYNVKSAYDENAQPANKDASVRVKPRTVIDAQLHVRSPYEKVKISLLVKKLSKKFILKCSACHNDYANGIIGPSLLNKSSEQIIQSISDFKSGKKSNPLMNDLINMMSANEIKSLALEIYKFNEEIKKIGK